LPNNWNGYGWKIQPIWENNNQVCLLIISEKEKRGIEGRGGFLVSRERLERSTLALKGQTRGIAIDND
jgi:hypothetical protein